MSGIGKTDPPTQKIWVLVWKAHSLLNIITSIMDFQSCDYKTAVLDVQYVQMYNF